MHLSDFFNMPDFATFLFFFKRDSQANLTFRKKHEKDLSFLLVRRQ